MELGKLRSTKSDSWLKSALGEAEDAVGSLGKKLFGFGDEHKNIRASALLKQVAAASDVEVAALAGAVASPLGDVIANAWNWVRAYPMALLGWIPGEPPLAENWAVWLRDLLRELARFELPSKSNDALLWLAIHCGALAEVMDSEFAAMMAKLLGGNHYRVGTTGGDHIGRMLASEISQGNRVSDDLFDTLHLVGICRHPAIPLDKRFIPTPHVARGLAGCGREEAIEALCETVTVDRDSSELVVAAAIQATAAAMEVLPRFPNVLPSVLETIAGLLASGKLELELLATELSPVLAVPAPLLAEPGCDALLRIFASALRDTEYRNALIDGEDESELFLGLSAEAALDIEQCGLRLVERYEQAHAHSREDTKRLLRTFARIREGQTPAMRPLWLRLLNEVLESSADGFNVPLLADVFSFKAATGRSMRDDCVIPTDTGLARLLELDRRLIDPSVKAQLAEVSQLDSVEQVDSTIIKLLIANLAGHPADALLPYVLRLDHAGLSLLADADFLKTDAQVRAAVFSRADESSSLGARLIVRAVAAASSVQELVDWLLERSRYHSVSPVFGIACALRGDRLELWRTLLLASKKPVRELGLHLLICTLKVIEQSQKYKESKVLSILPADATFDADALRRDAALVLAEYESQQSKKKSGDNLKSTQFETARRLSLTSDQAEHVAEQTRAAIARLCELVSQATGIDASRFTPSLAQPPRDRGSRYADIFGEVAPKLIEAIAEQVAEIDAQSLSQQEKIEHLRLWYDHRDKQLRDQDGLELLRAVEWFSGPGNWYYFDYSVFKQAQPLLSTEQAERFTELRPPVLAISSKDALARWVRNLSWEVTTNYEEVLIVQLDWYESVLANLPPAIQALGPTALQSPTPHPPHSDAIAYVYHTVCNWLRSREIDPQRKTKLRQRIWPLLWWAASFGNKLESIDAPTVGCAVASGLASLGDLVWFLVQADYKQQAGHLVKAVKDPSQYCSVLDDSVLDGAATQQEICKVIEAVACICRQQELRTDPQLPSVLANTWAELPAPPDQAGLVDVLRKFSQVEYQTVRKQDDQQKAFVARLRESRLDITRSWNVSGDQANPELVDFDKIDQWQKTFTHNLKRLLDEQIVSEDLLLRIGLDQPLLIRSTMEATGRSHQLEAVIWILFHAGSSLYDLAVTLNADSGHASLRRSAAGSDQLRERLVSHYGLDSGSSTEMFRSLVSDATIRPSWKRAAIDVHPREELGPIFKALKAVVAGTDRLRVEGLLEAMDGKFDTPAARQALEAAIKDRPNLALLQLAVMPLPQSREALVSEISRRLKFVEAVAIEGRKRKSGTARDNVQLALDQVRRSLASNAGLANPAQLEWLSGEAIAKELQEFARVESGEHVIQLQLRGDGPQLLISKAGKAVKTIPALFKSSDAGKRLVELQNRLKTSLRDVRAVLEQAMIQQRAITPDELVMMMRHPVVEAVASGLVFMAPACSAVDAAIVGTPKHDGRFLISLDGSTVEVTRPVRVAHALDLDGLGVLAAWQSRLTDQPPQAISQVERSFVRVADLETANDGNRIVRHDAAQIKNVDQAVRILQAHGWQVDRNVGEMIRLFRSDNYQEVTAVLTEFGSVPSGIGALEFRDVQWNLMSISEVPSIVLSEAVRDIDRTVSGATS